MKYVLVLGAGVTGLAAARFARKLGYDVTLSNDKPLDHKLQDELSRLGIRMIIGPQNATLLDGMDTLIPSPGIPDTHALIQAAQSQHLTFLSEIDLALAHYKGRVIAVTGTNGKSTTTAMTAHILNRCGASAIACGNIGLAPSQILYEERHYDYWVVELSSYQISIAKAISADAVIFTSFTPDHLARHGTLAAYFEAKFKLCLNAKPDAPILLSTEAHKAMVEYGKKLKTQRPIVIKSTEALDFSSTSIQTQHDRLNAVYAATCVQVLGSHDSLQDLVNLLSDFSALPFRYNHVGYTVNHKPIINDSKATNVDSCIKALENQSEPCILLLGGQPKGESFTPLTAFKNVIKEIWYFGAAKDAIEKDLSSSSMPLRKFATLKEALSHFKLEYASVDAPVLFSPACASFDEFKNFEERGHFFNEQVRSYANKNSLDNSPQR